MPESVELFGGIPSAFGGLSNERELVEACPEEFKRRNRWSLLAQALFFEGGKIGHWKWRSDDRELRSRQLGCLHGLLGTFGIAHEDKEAVAGWMLSEMLSECPQHVPQESGT